jgi:hypothetical protein
MISKEWRHPGAWLPCRSAVLPMVALAALAACSDAANSPLAAPPVARLSAAAGSGLTPNGVKYHDSGAPHATGRSGSATLEGRAVAEPGGVTRLVITTGALDGPSPAPGEIVKAQLKVYSADGALLFVENHNQLTGGGVQTFLLPDLLPGSTIAVQANVRGIDANRTDVVTLTAAVVRSARLGIELQLPGSASVGRPVVINGIVTELDGDMGTRADCVLYVDGREVDRADGIWVDAGGVVTCAFTYTFTTAGGHTVEVRVLGASGAGSVVANAGDSVLLDVDNGSQTTYAASVEDRSVTTTTVFAYTWWKPDGSHKEYSNTEVTILRDQTIALQGSLARPVAFPLTALNLSLESAGVEWQSEHWTALPAVVDPATGNACVSRQLPEHGALLFVCNGLGGASFGYSRFAGNVTYHSRGYANTFDGIGGVANNYSWNTPPTTSYVGGGQVRNLGTALQLRLSIQDAQGTFSFAPLVSLTPFSGNVSDRPLSCKLTSPASLEGGQLNECTAERKDEAGWRGSASSGALLEL